MPAAVAPNIYLGRYARTACPQKLSGPGRLLGLVLSLGCLSLLVVAAGLSPDAGGFGTHRQLGLQECGFLARTGLPCPACGMTTSFAWFARGNVPASFYVQPMGCVLAIISAMCVWAGGYAAVTGKPIHRAMGVIPEKIYLVPLLALVIAAWAWKIYIHLHGIDGWR